MCSVRCSPPIAKEIGPAGRLNRLPVTFRSSSISEALPSSVGRDKNFIDHRGRVLIKAEWVEGGCRISVE